MCPGTVWGQDEEADSARTLRVLWTVLAEGTDSPTLTDEETETQRRGDMPELPWGEGSRHRS